MQMKCFWRKIFFVLNVNFEPTKEATEKNARATHDDPDCDPLRVTQKSGSRFLLIDTFLGVDIQSKHAFRHLFFGKSVLLSTLG